MCWLVYYISNREKMRGSHRILYKYLKKKKDVAKAVRSRYIDLMCQRIKTPAERHNSDIMLGINVLY